MAYEEQAIYHTKTEEEHPKYHTNMACPEGFDIERANIVVRIHCKVCAELDEA
jgi:hypothetical protein